MTPCPPRGFFLPVQAGSSEGKLIGMHGYLVVNGYLDNAKFKRLYGMLSSAFTERGVSLEIVPTTSLMRSIGEPIDPKPDFVLFWDKDVNYAELLEQQGIPVFNNASSIALCDNKIKTAIALTKAGIPTPKTYPMPLVFEGLERKEWGFLPKIEEEIGYPMVVKEAYGSFGEQVYLVSNRDELLDLSKRLGHKDFLIQQYIPSSRGRDIRVNVVDGQAIVSMLRVNPNDFRSNISNGGKGFAVDPSPEFLELAVKACEALGLLYGGVDILFGPNDSPIVCEVNSNPQFGSTYDVTGIDLSGYIADAVLRRI